MFRRFRRPKSLCALDIGTTKVCALIGHLDDEGRLNVSGVGSCRSRGIRGGDVIDMDHTVDAILKAVRQAEDLAQTAVRDVIVGIAGGHIQSFNVEASVEVKNTPRGIDEKDRGRAVRKAVESLIVPADKDIIHSVPQAFFLNGAKSHVLNPLGISAQQLGVKMHLILASVSSARNLIRCVRRAGLRAADVVLESLASSLSILSDHEKELGCVLLDVGGGTTDVAVFKNGSIRATGETPLAGNSVTQDIQCCWKLSFHDAEMLKKKVGTALPMSVDVDEMVELPSLHANRPAERKRRRELAMITEARVEEILMMAKKVVEREMPLDDLHAGLVLTGGSAMLGGIVPVAERVFGLKCRIGYPQGIRGMAGVLASPIYSTGVGLLTYGQGEERNAVAVRGGWWSRVVQKWVEAYA
ncbi:MAG: cell division protein FtsA [Candidatus Sumerlaeota bacterium]|nr:cell division protein FtsA [Candidatus Sumerlaeota bacterium]